MTPLDLWLSFSLGLIGSLHCVQMCGPIVLAYSLSLGQATRPTLLAAHLAYNLGRLLTYAGLGALAGLLGGGMGALNGIAGAFNTAALIGGGLMIVSALFMAGLAPLPRALTSLASSPPGAWTRAAARFVRSPSPGAKLAMGLLLGFMPCGLVYAALLKAVETGSGAGGAVTMLAFGAGTVGMLLGTGLFSTSVSRRLGRARSWLPALAVLIMGAFLVWRGLTGAGPAMVHRHAGP
ncbi:MAG: sulfite exporter TauE/SafE family protein [Acidobacteriota bacterium]